MVNQYIHTQQISAYPILIAEDHIRFKEQKKSTKCMSSFPPFNSAVFRISITEMQQNNLSDF